MLLIKTIYTVHVLLCRRLSQKGVDVDKMLEDTERQYDEDIPSLPSSQSLMNSEQSLPHHEESSWFVRDCDRNTADKILGGKADGTFLIRPSSQVDCYALSVV